MLNEIAGRLAAFVPAALVLVCLAGPALAQADELIAPSLVHLQAEAEDSVGTPKKGTATGFLVTEDGQVLTVYHLLSGLEPYLPETLRISARVQERGPPFELSAAVINALPTLDLLLLKLPLRPEPYTPVKLGFSRSFPIGAGIRTSGFPLDLDGVLPDEGRIRSKQGPGGSVWVTNMVFNSGQSGSPIYDDNAVVIGVVKGQLADAPNINFFTPIDFADPLLIPLRLEEMEKRLSAVPKGCRVCFNAVGNAICSGALQSCSEWSQAGQESGAAGEDGWSEPLQFVQGDSNGFAECKLKWKLECR